MLEFAPRGPAEPPLGVPKPPPAAIVPRAPFNAAAVLAQVEGDVAASKPCPPDPDLPVRLVPNANAQRGLLPQNETISRR